MTTRNFWTAPRLWEGDTAVIVATGPSINQADVDYCRGKARVCCVNTSITLAPWADALYFADQRWFDHNAEAVKSFKGLKVTIENAYAVTEQDPTIRVMRNDDHREKKQTGLCIKPDGLRTGRNSGYQAVNLVYHLGVKRIVLLGFDLGVKEGKRWWFGDYGWASGSPNIYQNTFLPNFLTLEKPLAKAGVEVINATPDSALKCWPIMPLAEALKERTHDTDRNGS